LDWTDAVDWVVRNKQYALVDPVTGKRLEQEEEEGAVLLDFFSAQILQQVCKALKPENLAKFVKLPLPEAHELAFKVVERSKK